MSITKIDQKIIGYQVKQKANEQDDALREPVQSSLPLGIDSMNEAIERPDRLVGSTYKVKTPLSEHAMYITINDMILNEGTEHEQRRPFEMFINSKNMEHFQWIVALTRIVSAVFRKGGDITFLAEELGSVFDPQGGYFKQGGKYMPSLVAEIGDVLQRHLEIIGLIDAPKLDGTKQAMIAEKRAELAAAEQASGDFPASAIVCKKCMVKAAIVMDGCLTCLNCGESNCG